MTHSMDPLATRRPKLSFSTMKNDAAVRRRSRFGSSAALFILVSLFSPSVAPAFDNQEVPPCSVFDLFCSTGTSECAACKKACSDRYDADVKECNKTEIPEARLKCIQVAKGVLDRCNTQCTIDDKCQDSGG